jgi:DNA-binding Xre family transcriptional regulator
MKQEPVEPDDAPRVGFGHRKVLNKLTKGKNSKIRQNRIMIICTALSIQ